MAEHNNDGELNFDAEAEISWRAYVGDFNDRVWPLFKELGYTKDTALMVWLLNKNYNLTTELIDSIKELSEELRSQ
jgi:hypothetical protein